MKIGKFLLVVTIALGLVFCSTAFAPGLKSA